MIAAYFTMKMHLLTYNVTQHWMKSSNKMVFCPNRSYFRIKTSTKPSDIRYPNDWSAVFNSFRSMLPELSLSNDLKQLCQSVTYFQSAPKSWKLTEPRFSRSNIPKVKTIFRYKKKWKWYQVCGRLTNHHSDSFWIKFGPCSIAKRLFQFICRNKTTAIFVDSEFEREKKRQKVYSNDELYKIAIISGFVQIIGANINIHVSKKTGRKMVIYSRNVNKVSPVFRLFKVLLLPVVN